MKKILLVFSVLALALFLIGCGKAVEVPAPEPVAEPEPEPEPVVVEVGPVAHNVQVTDNGFVPADLTVAVGDSVTWTNVRTGNLKAALVVGTKGCARIKSTTLKSGDTFEHTFQEGDTCEFIEAVSGIQKSMVTVE